MKEILKNVLALSAVAGVIALVVCCPALTPVAAVLGDSAQEFIDEFGSLPTIR